MCGLSSLDIPLYFCIFNCLFILDVLLLSFICSEGWCGWKHRTNFSLMFCWLNFFSVDFMTQIPPLIFFHTATATRWRCQELLKVKLNNNYTSQNIKCKKKRDLILLNSFFTHSTESFFCNWSAGSSRISAKHYCRGLKWTEKYINIHTNDR